jgi:acyl dehydratase
MIGAGDTTSALEALRAWIGVERIGSDWIVVDQERIDRFAAATEDRYWLHTDPQRAARESPYGATIAHGFLLLSLTVGSDVDRLSALPGIARVLNYGLNKVRFVAPVVCGARVRVRSKPESLVARRPGSWLLTQTKTLDVEGQDNPALVAEHVALVTLA